MVTIDHPQEELQALIATSTTYQEPLAIARPKSSTAGSVDVSDYP